MKILDLRQIIDNVKKTVERHQLGTIGEYSRWLWQNKKGDRNLGVNEYGCADAFNILYTINEFYCDDVTRNARITGLLATPPDPR